MDWRKPHLSADVPVLALPCPTQRPVTDPARQRQRERPQILALRGAFALGQTAGPGGGLRGSTADADDPRGPVSPAASARRHRFADIRDTRNASRPPGRKPPPRSARPPLTAPAPGGPAQPHTARHHRDTVHYGRVLDQLWPDAVTGRDLDQVLADAIASLQ